MTKAMSLLRGDNRYGHEWGRFAHGLMVLGLGNEYMEIHYTVLSTFVYV